MTPALGWGGIESRLLVGFIHQNMRLDVTLF